MRVLRRRRWIAGADARIVPVNDASHPRRFPALGHPGVLAALLAAALFGAGTPAAKLLLASIDGWMLAGLLYLGSGLGLACYRLLGSRSRLRLERSELPWLAGSVLFGGLFAPVLLMLGLTRLPASDAALLLNAESVLTAVLAWMAFKESVDRRIGLGMLAIVAGAVVLSWSPSAGPARFGPALAVVGACLCWAFDNNLTRKVALADAVWLASIKGCAAGTVNLLLSLSLGAHFPPPMTLAAAMLVGLFAYGVSLVLFIVALRHLGTARTGAYFSVAPFFGAALSALALRESPTAQLLLAGLLMALGVWLHLTERHAHEHLHAADEHEHEHVHDGDEHHRHAHALPVAPGTRHTHRHRHMPLRHAHPHMPDAHHRHEH